MTDSRPALLCFDGSEDACRAIGDAGGLLAPRPAVVLTVWETARRLTPLDPMGDAVGRVSGIYADLDAAGLQAARDVVQRGAQLAQEAGFQPRTRVECGSVWQTIVAIGAEEDAAVIVIGARGLSRVAAVLGSVPPALRITPTGRSSSYHPPRILRMDRDQARPARAEAHPAPRRGLDHTPRGRLDACCEL
jgi:nucleotide-binding universal stress UspA family protein